MSKVTVCLKIRGWLFFRHFPTYYVFAEVHSDTQSTPPRRDRGPASGLLDKPSPRAARCPPRPAPRGRCSLSAEAHSYPSPGHAGQNTKRTQKNYCFIFTGYSLRKTPSVTVFPFQEENKTRPPPSQKSAERCLPKGARHRGSSTVSFHQQKAACIISWTNATRTHPLSPMM